MVDGSDDAHELTAERPSDYGHAGLKAAKEQAEHYGDLKVDLFMPRPLQMETAKASIERPTASNTSSASPIVWLPLCGRARVYLLGE